jgi:hypothetical protein
VLGVQRVWVIHSSAAATTPSPADAQEQDAAAQRQKLAQVWLIVSVGTGHFHSHPPPPWHLTHILCTHTNNNTGSKEGPHRACLLHLAGRDPLQQHSRRGGRAAGRRLDHLGHRPQPWGAVTGRPGRPAGARGVDAAVESMGRQPPKTGTCLRRLYVTGSRGVVWRVLRCIPQRALVTCTLLTFVLLSVCCCPQLPQRLAVVVGTESSGISSEMRDAADRCGRMLQLPGLGQHHLLC